jgi:hypothetical protein
MSQPVHTLGLIDTKRAAIVVSCLTGFLMLINLRHGIAHPNKGSYWIFDTRWFLPVRAAMMLNLILYMYLLWIGIALYRAAQGKERLIVIGWFVPIFLGPIQYLFSISPDVIGYMDFFAILTAFFAAASILVKLYVAPQFDNQNSQ